MSACVLCAVIGVAVDMIQRRHHLAAAVGSVRVHGDDGVLQVRVASTAAAAPVQVRVAEVLLHRAQPVDDRAPPRLERAEQPATELHLRAPIQRN